MKNLAFYLLLCLATSLHAQQNQTPQHLPNLGPSPTLFDPAQLNDFEPPTVVCLNGLSANLMNNGTLTLQANDLLQFVLDNVTPIDQILLGMRVEGTGIGFPLDAQSDPVVNLSFNCDDLGDPTTLELWAMDAAGNAAFCSVHFILQDNLNACNPGANVLLCAKTMCSDEIIEEVTFVIQGSATHVPTFELFLGTSSTGCSDIISNIPVANTFSLKASKENTPLNGIDEQDFALLSNHINGTQPFTEPWQWVAADVNRDGQITLEDSIELRHLMLGIISELPNNSSWRFIPRNYQFPSPDPLSQPIPETITIAELTAFMDTSFWGIKIGDLDCSSSPNFTSSPNGSRNEPGQQEKTAPPVDPTQLNDFEPPMVVCKNSTRFVKESGMVVVSVQEIRSKVSDNATPLEYLELGIKKAGSAPGFPVYALGGPRLSDMFTCDELGTHTVELWAKDLAGNTAYCEATVEISDPFDFCPTTPIGAFVDLRLTTEIGDGVEEGLIEFSGQHPNLPFIIKNWNWGLFELPGGSNVTITPTKDDNPLNGVTTYDRVLISFHYNGVQRLDSPYKIIAADVNRDGVIDVKDSLDLINLILGNHTSFPNNTSWRFIPKDYKFLNPLNPLSEPFPEFVTINNLVGYERVDFIGIKVGDVNNTANANAHAPNLDERTQPISPISIGLPQPNPTHAGSAIPVFLPQPETLRIELYDLNGKPLWFNEQSFDFGNQVLDIPAAVFTAPGMYVWRVRAGNVVKTGKLVNVIMR